MLAGQRPVIVVSERDSVDDRMVALGAGAADAVGWTDNLPEVLARVAGLLRRSRIAAGQPGEGALRISLIDRRVELAGRLIRPPLPSFVLLANPARVPSPPPPPASLFPRRWPLQLAHRPTPAHAPI